MSTKEKTHEFRPLSQKAILDIIKTYIHPRKISNETGSFVYQDISTGKELFFKWFPAESDKKELLINLRFNSYADKKYVKTPDILGMTGVPNPLSIDPKDNLTVVASEYIDPRWGILSNDGVLVSKLFGAWIEMQEMPYKWLSNINAKVDTTGTYSITLKERLKTLAHKTEVLSSELASSISNYTDPRIKQHFVPAIVHRDFTHHNFKVQEDGPIILYDLEDMGIGNHFEDVARFVNDIMVNRYDIHEYLVGLHSDKLDNLNAFRIYKALYLVEHYANKIIENRQSVPKGVEEVGSREFTRDQLLFLYWLNLVLSLINNQKSPSESDIKDLKRYIDDARNVKKNN